ncbi:hypothetical protein PV325_004999 [Microctonus aethiopoides]|nr:hypothetical protein PV325_004999 [Microctonus aethiopoides]
MVKDVDAIVSQEASCVTAARDGVTAFSQTGGDALVNTGDRVAFVDMDEIEGVAVRWMVVDGRILLEAAKSTPVKTPELSEHIPHYSNPLIIFKGTATFEYASPKILPI